MFFSSRSDWPQLSDVLAQIAAMETAQERPPTPPPPAYDDVITVGYQALPRRSSSVVSSIRSHPPAADRTLNTNNQQTTPPTENQEEPVISIEEDTNSITKLDEDQVYSLVVTVIFGSVFCDSCSFDIEAMSHDPSTTRI